MQVRHKWRRVSAAGCAVGALALFYGTQGAAAELIAPPTAHKAATTTLTFVTTNTNQPGYVAAIASFEQANPSITVNASYLASNSYNTLIPTELAAGNAPDVFTAFPGTGTLPSLELTAQAGDLAPIPLKGNFKAIPKDALPEITYKGKVYGYPEGQSAYFLIYNSTLFKSLGLTVPKTYAQLNALCTTIKADGKIPLTQAGSSLPNDGVNATELAAATVYEADPNWNTQRAKGKTTFANTKGWQEAMGEFASLASNDCFEPGSAGQSQNGATAQLASGQALMYLANSQNIGLTLAVNPNFPLGVAPTPAETAKQQVVMVAYPINTVIYAHSPNLAAAQTFVNFMAEPSIEAEWAYAMGYSSLAQVNHHQLTTFIKPLDSFYKKGLTRVNPFFAWPNPEVFGDEAADVQGLLTGQETPAQVLAAMDSAW